MLEFGTNNNDMKFDIAEESASGTKIKVIGVGGAGGNAAARMMQAGLEGVEFYVLNTDVQALQASPVPNKLAIGSKITSGLGAGSDPSVGRQAALEDTERIIELIEGADMVFVTAGLGGGTGTGAAPVVAALAKELGALTVAVVTKPFEFEGARRMKQALNGLEELTSTVDTVITIPNERLLEIAPEDASFIESCRIADDVLRQAVQGICDIITRPGLINRDFSDVRAIMLGMGHAMMGTATACGSNAAVTAAKAAISCPLLEEGGVAGARGLLINVTGSHKLGLRDVTRACSLIREATGDEDVQMNFGVVLDEAAGDEVKITVIATGFHHAAKTTAPVPAPMRRVEPPVVRQPESEPEMEEEMEIASAEYAEPEQPRYQAPPQHVQVPERQHVNTQATYAQPRTQRPEQTMQRPPQAPMDDLETPAILRRDRRLFQ
jgi:cell division protein FtsZ